MKKKKALLPVIAIIISISCFGQVRFEKGYFINNDNQKVECFIKNKDLRNNPKAFEYKLSENEEIKKVEITDVKEFSIANYIKFIRADVDIDTSYSILSKLSTVKNPLWQHKQLFLKVLVEGKAKLYQYTEDNFERFFYSCKDSIIKQLIYKEYFSDNDHTAVNNSFCQQLISYVSCADAPTNSAIKLDYNKKQLEKYFQQYNSCVDPTYKVAQIKQPKGKFNLGILTRLDYSSLSVGNDVNSVMNVNFNNILSWKFGLEIEYILPFYKNTWGIVIDPIYQSYHSDAHTENRSSTIDYTSIDLSAGIKHYFFLNDDTKLFVDGYINSITSYFSNSKFGYKSNYGGGYSYLDITKNNPNFAFGAGLEYKRIFAELRYFTNQEILTDHGTWYSDYRKISFIVGYKIFK